MEKIHAFVEKSHASLAKWKPAIESVLVCLTAIATIALAVIAFKSDKTFDREAGLLTEATKAVEQERLHFAREAFDKALDEAETYCTGCQESAPSFGILIPLNKALMREPELKDILTAAEYNRLALLGSSAWEFEKTNGFASQALARSHTPIDKFMSNLVLGHLCFVNYKNDNDPASLRHGRDYFQSSVKALDDHNSTDAFRVYLGQAHAAWATHERAIKDTEESHRHYILAKAHWEGLSGCNDYVRQLDVQLSEANLGHIPNISCLFHISPQPGCVAGAVATIESSSIPSPAMAPACPAAPSAPKPDAPAPSPAKLPPAPLSTLDKTIDDFTAAIGTNPIATNYFGRAYYYEKKAQAEYDLAVADYTEAIRLNPNYIAAYIGRAYAYLHKMEHEKSKRDSAEAARLSNSLLTIPAPKTEPAPATAPSGATPAPAPATSAPGAPPAPPVRNSTQVPALAEPQHVELPSEPDTNKVGRIPPPPSPSGT